MIYGKSNKNKNFTTTFVGKPNHFGGKFIRVTKNGTIDKRQINKSNMNWKDLGIRGI